MHTSPDVTTYISVLFLMIVSALSPPFFNNSRPDSLGQQIGSLIELDLDFRGQWGSETIMCYFGLWVVGFRGMLIRSKGFNNIEKWE